MIEASPSPPLRDRENRREKKRGEMTGIGEKKRKGEKRNEEKESRGEYKRSKEE